MPTNEDNQTGTPSDSRSEGNADEALANLPQTSLTADQSAQVKGGVMKAGSDNITMENFTTGPRGYNPKEMGVDKSVPG